VTEVNRQDNLLLELNKAQASLKAAHACAALALWDDAVSRAYAAAFHLASALLFSVGAEARSRRDVPRLLLAHFVGPGLLPRALSKQYAVLERLHEDVEDVRGLPIDEECATEALDHAQALDQLVRGHLSHQGLRVA
jgi:uncharacterized protein (UPF0332 family)